MESAVHLSVRGRVQGVYFRAGTEKSAKELGLTGWVRNCQDGSVEIHAEGTKEKIEKFIEWCRKGPVLASVKEIDIEWIAPKGLSSFEII